jgi:membrane-associated protease RseP (regulator of RpoE activity)
MHVMQILIYGLEALVVFNLIILAHELGRFLVARRRGLKVERVTLGCGKTWWQFQCGGMD